MTPWTGNWPVQDNTDVEENTYAAILSVDFLTTVVVFKQ